MILDAKEVVEIIEKHKEAYTGFKEVTKIFNNLLDNIDKAEEIAMKEMAEQEDKSPADIIKQIGDDFQTFNENLNDMFSKGGK